MNERVREITRLIEPSLEAMGYVLVRVQLSGGQRPTLQIMAERKDEAPMTVADCTEISRATSALLDVADPIAGSYVLEASSPGIDRPLVRARDYERFCGHLARIELREPVAGRRRFTGKIIALENAGVRLATDEGQQVLGLDAIEQAKLVLTDELIAAEGARRRAQAH